MDEQLFPPQPAHAVHVPDLGPQLGAIATRLKLAEERYTNLQKRNQLTQEQVLSFEQDSKAEMRALTQQLNELRKHLGDIRSRVDGMRGELASAVQKHDLVTLERYLDLWQPMSFLTRDEAKRLIEDALRREGNNA